MNESDKIYSLLTKNGFTYELNDKAFLCDYIGIYPNYDKRKETVIVTTDGIEIDILPDNYYALLGWLIENQVLGFNYVKPL